MLKACLSDNREEVTAAASQWDKEIVMDDLDYSMMRLVPLFYLNIRKFGYKSGHEKRLLVLYKYWWLKSEHIRDTVCKATETLNGIGITPIIIKGAAITRYYAEPVLRPMADFDLMVPAEDTLRAYRALTRNGWQSTETRSEFLLLNHNKLFTDFYHSIELENRKDGTKMDLHWRVGNFCSWEFTSEIWRNIEPSIRIPGSYTLKLEYELCLMLLHASMYGSKDNLNWIVDIHTLREQLSRDQWSKARELAKMEQKHAYFDQAIRELRDHGIDPPLPSQAVKRLPIPIHGETLWKQRKWFRYALLECRNLWLITKHLYPGMDYLLLPYQFLRHVRLSVITHLHMIRRAKKTDNPSRFEVHSIRRSGTEAQPSIPGRILVK